MKNESIYVLIHDRLFFIVCLICLIIGNGGCIKHVTTNLNNESLSMRIQQFYNNWIELNYSDCYEFWLPNVAGNKKEFIERVGRIPYRIVDFNIDEIIVERHEAKVRMVTTKVEDNEKTTGIYCDYWVYNNGNWYLIDFGRGDGEDVVQEILIEEIK